MSEIKSCEVFAPLNTKELSFKENEPLIITGVASTTSRDNNGETVSREVISSLADQAVGLNVFIDHDHRFDKAVGTITEATVTDDRLEITAHILPEHAKFIGERLDFGMNFGLSIAGMPKFDRKDKGLITGYDLKEISITSFPANWDTYGTIQVKSIVKSNSFAGAIQYMQKSDIMADEANKNEIEETNTKEEQSITTDDVISLINDAFAEKEKAIVEAVKSEIQSNIESIVDAKLTDTKEEDEPVENEKEDETAETTEETEEEIVEEILEEKECEEDDMNQKSMDDLVEQITANIKKEFEAPISKFKQYQQSMNKKADSTFLNSEERDRYGRNKKYL